MLATHFRGCASGARGCASGARGCASGARGCVSSARFALRQVDLDLQASRKLRLVLPTDWRDVPHTKHDPPFWAVPWPSGTATALHLLEDTSCVAGKRVCDLGCGVAPAGLAAGLAGAAQVTFADRNPSALRCAMAGAAANGLDDRCAARQMDWLADKEADEEAGFDVVLACDVCYSLTSLDGTSTTQAVAHAARTLLQPRGELLVALPIESEFRPHANRSEADKCIATIGQAGFRLDELVELRGAQLPGEGPEGLAPSRGVLLGRMSLCTSRA